MNEISNLEKLSKNLKEGYLKKEQKPYIEVGCGSSVEKDGFLAGKEAAEKAVSEIKLYDKYNLALAFISSEYKGQFEEILKGVHSVIEGTEVIGCTGVGEIKDKRLYGSIVLTLIASDNFEAEISVIKDIDKYLGNYDKAAFDLISNNSINDPTFGIIFIPGLCGANDMITCSPLLIDSLKGITQEKFPIIGAQAGDDWKFKKTYQFYREL